MINFKQYLEEGRDAPLFHAASRRPTKNVD